MSVEIKPINYDREYLDILATADLYACGREKYLLTTRDLLLGIIAQENMATRVIQRAQYGFLNYKGVLTLESERYSDQYEPFNKNALMTEPVHQAIEKAKLITCTRSRNLEKAVINLGAIDLLLGIYLEENSVASKVLRRCGLKKDRLMRACDDLIFGN